MSESRPPSAVSDQPSGQANIASELGAAMIEYILILGLVTALVAFFFRVFYPAGGDDLESMINRWGDKLASEIAGSPDEAHRMGKNSGAWGEN
jgi:Flp pilus assembly pilin Flp